MDSQLEEAIEIVCQYDKVATSLLQRKLSIGYAKAAKIMVRLADLKVISKPDGSKIVDVLIKNPKEVLRQLKENASVSKTQDDLIKLNASIIEKTLETFKITARVAEVQKIKYAVEYRIEIALGTNLNDITKHRKDIALAVASPSGDVYIRAPIPGRSLIGITIPSPVNDQSNRLKTLIGSLLLLVASWIEYFGYRILY